MCIYIYIYIIYIYKHIHIYIYIHIHNRTFARCVDAVPSSSTGVLVAVWLVGRVAATSIWLAVHHWLSAFYQCELGRECNMTY